MRRGRKLTVINWPFAVRAELAKEKKNKKEKNKKKKKGMTQDKVLVPPVVLVLSNFCSLGTLITYLVGRTTPPFYPFTLLRGDARNLFPRMASLHTHPYVLGLTTLCPRPHYPSTTIFIPSIFAWLICLFLPPSAPPLSSHSAFDPSCCELIIRLVLRQEGPSPEPILPPTPLLLRSAHNPPHTHTTRRSTDRLTGHP